MTTIRCAHCQSEDVWRSRIAYWSADRGSWIDEEFSDDYGCNECGGNELEFLEPKQRDMGELLNEVFRKVIWEKRNGRG